MICKNYSLLNALRGAILAAFRAGYTDAIMVVVMAIATAKPANCHEKLKKSPSVLIRWASCDDVIDEADFAAQYPTAAPIIPPIAPVMVDSM